MSETFFPLNDLLRRKFQTSLVITSLTVCVASTLFLLLFSDKVGFGVSLMAEGRLTTGFSSVFTPFIVFLGILVFVVGVVMVSFMVFLMMSQRVRDIGLMKAAGCPNDMVFGYFMNELLIVTLVGCLLGVALGMIADFALASVFAGFGFQIPQKAANPWLAILVFAVFFGLALIFGAKPIIDTTKIEPIKALSPAHYAGLSKEPGFTAMSRSGLTVRMALRSLFRRKSATIRIVLCLSTVFTLVTVTVAGGIIADQTTKSWVERAIGRDTVLVAHRNMTTQYRMLLSKFYETTSDSQFDYTDEKYLIPDSLVNQLGSLSESITIDARLIVKGVVKEIQGVTLGETTDDTKLVGRFRSGESLIVGVEPEKVLNEWFVDGRFLQENASQEAVVGDSLGMKMFDVPLVQGMKLFNDTFSLSIVGVCLDPINNGNVTYVPLTTLQSIMHVPATNIIMVQIDPLVNRTEVLNRLKAIVNSVNSEIEVSELNDVLDLSLGFLGYIWSAVMFLPIFSLVAASLCLVGYVVLTINEQQQEFGVLRALGAKPVMVVRIVSLQSLVALLSSYGAGVAIGIVVTLMVLVSEPLVTSFTILEISGWLLTALASMFILSLYPALRFARKPILEMMI
jgi:ABC-type antimicrobial peptide transport system permease subunit